MSFLGTCDVGSRSAWFLGGYAESRITHSFKVWHNSVLRVVSNDDSRSDDLTAKFILVCIDVNPTNWAYFSYRSFWTIGQTTVNSVGGKESSKSPFIYFWKSCVKTPFYCFRQCLAKKLSYSLYVVLLKIKSSHITGMSFLYGCHGACLCCIFHFVEVATAFLLCSLCFRPFLWP